MPDTELHKLLAEKERRSAGPAAVQQPPQQPQTQAPQQEGPSLEQLQQEREIRSRRANEDQRSAPTTPSAPVQDADPLVGVPTEIGGVTLTPDIREQILEARALTDPKDKRLASARIAGRLAAQSDDEGFFDSLTKGSFGAGLRGFGAGIFGLGDLAAAGGTFINSQFSDNSLSFGEALEAQREFRHALEEESPTTSTLGEVGGAVIGGFGLAGGAVKAAKVLGPRAAAAAASAAALQKGQKVRNVLRLAGAGAAGGAVTEGITEGEAGQGALIGAVGGPLGAGFVKAAGVTLKAGAELLKDPATKGLKALAKTLKIEPNELGKRFEEFRAVMGKPPSIADIANEDAVAELRDIIAERTGASTIARQAGREATERRAGEVSAAIGDPRVTTTALAQETRRTGVAEKAFAKADDDVIRFTPDEVNDLLNDANLLDALPTTLSRRIGGKITNAPERASLNLTGLDVNDIRKALAKRARGATGADLVFKELKDEVQEIGGRESPKFKQAIDEFARRSRTIEGVAAGRRAVTQRTSELEALAADAAPEVGAGIRAGVRSEIADVAGENAARSISVSRSLTEDSGLLRRLQATLKPEEVSRLQKIARVQVRSAENTAKLGPSAVARQASEARALVTDAAIALVGAKTGLGGAAKAAFFARQLKKITRLPENVVESLARDAFDPAKTQQVIAAMRRAQVPEQEILSLFTSAATGAALQ